jgi:DNA-binding beta-propeller fold protein YncE
VFEDLEGRRLLAGDVLYIGDAADDSVKGFDAHTGEYLGTFVAAGAGGLHGPRGMIFRNPGTLLVANQNVDQPFNGEALRFNGQTGALTNALVPASNADAPFAPRGMVVKDNALYVADLQGADTDEGRIAFYDANTGQFLGQFTPAGFAGQFNPRAVVFGPDGGLYVSAFDFTNLAAGYVLRFDTATGAYKIIAANDGDGVAEPGETQDLHRPEGLTFGPDGKLYVTSYRADATDNDRIIGFNASSGAVTTEINLDLPGQPRAFGQAIEFGPGGKLFVPISGNGPDTGSVRSYDVATGTYSVLVQPGGALGSGWYLTFGQTNPATLAYDTRPGAETSQATPAASAPAVSVQHSAADDVLVGVLKSRLRDLFA